MGHERLGLLPKTKPWKQIIQQIADSHLSESDIESIASQTIDNVRNRLRNIHSDKGILAAFNFIVTFAIASGLENPFEFLFSNGIQIDRNASLLSIAKAIHKVVTNKAESLEYGEIGQSAAVDALALWYESTKGRQLRLFDYAEDPFAVWRKASDGGGFCGLARLFFAKFTERYLNYFLERISSSSLKTVNDRELFRTRLKEHVDSVSRHAFETARITQSFAAGWFNKYATKGIPREDELEGFLLLAFGKIREELRREKGTR